MKKPFLFALGCVLLICVVHYLCSCSIPNAGSAVQAHAAHIASPMGMAEAAQARNNFWGSKP